MKRPDLRLVHCNARRLARRSAAIRYRSVVVPLLHREETEFGLDLACKLAADRGAHVVLVAPLVVPQELPLKAHFQAELAELGEHLDRAASIAGSYGIGVKRRIVRTREHALGLELAEIAHYHRAELVVVGAPVESRRGFRHPFAPEILSIVREAPCRVMIATSPVVARPGVGGGPAELQSPLCVRESSETPRA